MRRITRVTRSTPPHSIFPLPVRSKEAQKCEFDVDVVYTWVDGSDPAWQAKYTTHKQKCAADTSVDAQSASRFRNNNELQHSVDSVLAFAPWVRRIFIVTDDQTPAWVGDEKYKKVSIVSHSQIFTAAGCAGHLPTFNSHAIEAHLHHVPGLSEHFIYSNDDTFMGANVEKSDFFTPDGKVKVFWSANRIPTARAHAHMEAYTSAQINTLRLMRAAYPRKLHKEYAVLHQMKPMRKLFGGLASQNTGIARQITRTSASKFRAASNVAPVDLYIRIGEAHNHTQTSAIRNRYQAFTPTNDAFSVFSGINREPVPKLYCVNDAQPGKLGNVDAMFKKYLPHNTNSQEKRKLISSTARPKYMVERQRMRQIRLRQLGKM